MGGFVAMYNYLGFELTGPEFGMPLWLTSFIFLAYLAGTVSSPRAGRLASRHSRKQVLVWGNVIMMAGVGLTLIGNLWVIIVGMVVLTGGFFASHAVASGWLGPQRWRDGRSRPPCTTWLLRRVIGVRVPGRDVPASGRLAGDCGDGARPGRPGDSSGRRRAAEELIMFCEPRHETHVTVTCTTPT